MTEISHIDLPAATAPRFPLALAARLAQAVLAFGFRPAAAGVKSLGTAISLVGRSTAMAYADPFTGFRPRPTRPDLPQRRL